MKQRILLILAALLLLPMRFFGQTYQQLWNQVTDAEERDLPKTAMKFLEKIEDKARKEKAYGQLLKASLLNARVQAEVAPDSLGPAVARLEQQAAETKDVALKAVYCTVLSKIISSNSSYISGVVKGSRNDYRKQALANPDVLAKTSAGLYEPFVIKGKDSEKYYGNDLLSVIGYELSEWRLLHEYYSKVGNRSAACLTAAKYVYNIDDLDSLIDTYGDLPEACELAIKRCGMMYGSRYDTGQRLAYLRQTLNRWDSWPGANSLRNDEHNLTRPEFSARMPQSVVMPDEGQQLTLQRIRNVQELTMRIYRTTLKGDSNLNPNRDEDYKKMKSGLKELTELRQTRHYPLRTYGAAKTQENEYFDYEYHDDSLTLKGLTPGVYMVEFSSPQTEPSRCLYFVSGIRVVSQPMPHDQVRYVVVDARTGQPVAGAELTLFWHKGWDRDSKTEHHICNAQGEALLQHKDRMPDELFAYTKTDEACPMSDFRGSFTYYKGRYENKHTTLYTDRSIYRPGQTVYVNAIVWKEKSALDNEAVADEKVSFELRDANYKRVAMQTAVTDRYGHCSVVFTLPTGKLNGRFSISSGNASTSFSVEEYKRPTFQVEFPEYKESYKAGDTVHAQGKALSYAGVPVQGAKVKYTVKRRVAYWWLSYSWYWRSGYYGSGLDETVLKEGHAETADDGTFTVEMPLKMPDNGGSSSMYYQFVVEADVTDQAGETHSGSMSLPLGTKPTALTCNLPQQVRRDKLPEVTFTRRNAAGQEIEGTVRYRLDGGEWTKCAANAPMSLLKSQTSNLKPQISSGEHRLEAICEADTIDMKFVVFGLDDQKPATDTRDWFYVSHNQFPNDGGPVTVQVGSSDPDLYIVYGIYAGDEVIESGVVRKSSALLNRKLTYKEEYGNGLLLSFAWVKDGKCYKHQQQLMRPVPDKQLRLEWTTFRDRLTPGQQEEWSLKILKPDGKPADASFMAVLYDKSLDQLRQHQWSLAPSNYIPLPSTNWLFQTWGSLGWSCMQLFRTPLDVPELSFSHFDEDVFPSYYSSYSRRPLRFSKSNRAFREEPMMMESRPMVARELDAEGAMQQASMLKEVNAADAVATNDAQQQEEPKLDVQLRENLNETAFCYPSLVTDKDGNVVLKFTLPECLTTWRFMGIANTPQMLYGSIEGETVAKKDVMVQPNIPRFVRMGDAAQLSARIINTSDHNVLGYALLELSDPDTEKVVLEEKIPFGLEAEKTTSVTFNLSPEFLSSLSNNLLVCKVIVAGEGFSDGERHYLPVLPDREYVTKTVPYTQHEPGVKTIDLMPLFPQGTTQQKLTIEYTNNPAWFMVQSLPVVGQPWEHSAIDQAASYYSNALAKALMAQSPQVKDVFEQWRRENAQSSTQNTQPTTLNSQLEKNQELKDVLLAETPWVNAADRETEQRQRLADFFDMNGINNRLSTAVTKLQKLQNYDGSFSWYEGMQGSSYITVAVAEMLARLQVMAGELEDTKQLQSKAFDYLGKEMVECVKELKKLHKPTFPSFTALRWLYICALDGRELPSDVKKANEYLMKLLKKDIKRQTIYEKALTAVILAKRGEAKLAADYVQSLKEYTVFTEEMGRYYDTPRAAYSWYDYKIPTEVAAVEAIQAVTPDDQQTVNEMRRWLLQEKRTQAWGTPINSVNAIYAFLKGNSPLTTNYAPTVLAIDGTPIDAPKATAGIGYVKTAIQQPQGKTFTATKTSEGTSWGAVYAQFLQKTTDIEQSGSGITVKREVLVSDHNSQFSNLNSQLKVGDRIKVRITIETIRDLDFVQVVDRRAACMEPVRQLSGYHDGAYVSPKDFATYYYYGGLAKGKYTLETEYFIDRAGQYETGTCTVQCAYAPEYRATAPSTTLNVEQK